MKQIDDERLMMMIERGDQQKDIAVFFGVSPAAICKRKKELQREATIEAALEPLTDNQRRFVAEICSGTNQTNSALAAYDCLPDSAKPLGNKLMKNEGVTTAINVIMEMQGLSRSHLITRLKHHVDGKDPQISLRATTEALKLHDAFPANRNVNININVDCDPVDLSRFRLRD